MLVSNLPNALKIYSCQFFFCYARFHVLFCFSLSDKIIYNTAIFFFLVTVWVLESHRLEMSKCKTVIDLWDVMQSAPGCSCFFCSVNVQFSPYCAIILPKNDFKTYFITTCKYQRCPIPWQKIYKCCFILFSIFWKTAMMFMWCIVFQLVAIIKNTSCRRLVWLFI